MFCLPATRRPALLLCLACLPGVAACDGDGGLGPGAEGIGLELVAEGLTAPVALAEAPDGTGRLFVADQAGLLRIIAADGALQEAPFLDLRDRLVDLRTSFDERGLLGFAFHPQFSSNGRFFVYYSAPLRAGAPSGFDHTARIAEYRVGTSPDEADAMSERVLLEVDEPQFNHNGGTLAFGPDGYLYVSLGDGGGRDDVGLGHEADWYEANEGGNAQNVEANLLGKILRIDVDGGDPYGVPQDNPFVGQDGLDEIWAYGFRNPYRFSFDIGGGTDIIVGDAGQDLYEEVSVVTRGGNYGWNVKEGLHCFSPETPESPPATCPDEDAFGAPLVDPVIEYANAGNGGLGVVVVGGYIYRGSAIPSLSGQYVFGDYSRSSAMPDGSILVATPTGSAWSFEEQLFAPGNARLGHYLLGFGQDAEGEVYVLTSDRSAPIDETGRVYRLALTGDS